MTALPPDVLYGYVTDKVLRSTMDTPADVDQLPDGVAAQGTVTLSPTETIFTGDDGKTTIVADPYKFTINQSTDPNLRGLLVNPATGHTGPHAVVAGWYQVSYKVDGYTKTYGPFHITPEHTLADPFWIRANIPLVQTPTTKFVVNEAILLEVRQIRDSLLDLGASPEQIEQAVLAYFADNPPEVPDLAGVVLTVNGQVPDAEGNVVVEGGGGTAEPFRVFASEAEVLAALTNGEIDENEVIGVVTP